MDNLSQIPLTMATTIAGAAVGTTTTLTIANDVQFCIKGKGYKKSAVSNTATPTTDYATGAAFDAIAVNKAGVFVLCLNSSGALKVVQGSIVDYNDDGTFATVAPQFPVIPDDVCPFAYELVKVISTGSSWTFGSSNQASQTGITKVLVDVFTLPSRPQTS
jgi:hypothetical protein